MIAGPSKAIYRACKQGEHKRNMCIVAPAKCMHARACGAFVEAVGSLELTLQVHTSLQELCTPRA